MADKIDDGILNSVPSGAANQHNISNGASTGPQIVAGGLDRTSNNLQPLRSGIVQPKPQALPKRTGPNSIIVSPRQKGNPILNNIKSMPWEYGDIPADYVLGLTTCALFLSLKYHRLHPEYIYTRMRNLQGKYNLRIILVMVDIQNHEESLRELSKTSLINNVTLVLCWSAAEGGRYLELFKTYENASPSSIKQHQSTSYSDRLVDFVTTPRSINKTDAVSLVSQFGTIRTAVNARHEDVAVIAGWGEKKIQQWCAAVREPFRIKRAAKRGLERGDTSLLVASQPVSIANTPSKDISRKTGDNARLGSGDREASSFQQNNTTAASRQETAIGDVVQLPRMLAEDGTFDNSYGKDNTEFIRTKGTFSLPTKQALESTSDKEPSKRKHEDDHLSDGVITALQKLRRS